MIDFRSLMFLTIIPVIQFCSPVYGQTAVGDRINLESEPGMQKGTIFFMPETDSGFRNTAITSNTINGCQFFTTWGTIEKTEGVYDWSNIDNTIAAFKASGKKLALCIPTTNSSINDTPEYLYNNYGLRRIVAGYWESFESTRDKGYIFYGIKTTGNPISGNKSLQMATSATKTMFETGVNHVFNLQKGITNPTYNPSAVMYPNRPSPGFCLQFDYRANSATSFTVKAYSKSNTALPIFEETWNASSGEKGMKTFNFYPSSNDYKLELIINNAGDLTVDNINICDKVTGYHIGTLCFPNYFNPVFKEKYEVFVKALADRYRNEEVVNSINVGGYGRWEEITISAEEPNMFEDQWATFGYSNEKYVEHIKSCIDMYKRLFPEKRLYTGAVGWNMEGWRDQNYIDWKVQNYAVKNGVSIKYNGWQAMCSEWESPNTGFQYSAHRHKYNKNVWVMYEEAGQINNMMSEYMGHPISLLNKAIIDGIDYNWMYSVDLSQPYINKYFHYANESAGATLTTKMYNLFGRTDYYSPHAQKTFVHKNIWIGLYQRDDPQGTKFDYVVIDGQKAVQTSGTQSKIQISVDDRMRYHEMYGAYLSVDYLDKGTDVLKLSAKLPTGLMEIAAIKKTNTNEWKTITVKDTGWLSKAKNNGSDDLIEIEINDNGDGIETIKSMEINYVPAPDFQEKVVLANEPQPENRTLISNTYTFDIQPPAGNSSSSIAVNVSPATNKYVNIEAVVTAVINGQNKVITTKEYFMPEDNDWFTLPVANAAQAASFRVSLKVKTGSAYLNLGSNSNPAFRLYSYLTESGEADVDQKIEDIEALRSYSALLPTGTGQLKLQKRGPNETYMDVETLFANASEILNVTPQPAGYYRLIDASGKVIRAIPQYLKKLPVSNQPKSFVMGNKVTDFKGDSTFKYISGLKNTTNDDMGFHARLTHSNPVLVSVKSLNLSFSNLHQVHFIIKNETASSLAKIYWKTDQTDYSETNSVLLPVVPNDDHYREYTYPIGQEPTWRGKILEIKFLPVTGQTDAGKIHIYAFDIRKGTPNASAFGDALTTPATDFRINSDTGTTGLNVLSRSGASATIYPNPVSEVANVTISFSENNKQGRVAPDEDFKVSVYTITGALLGESQQKGGQFALNLGNYPAGTLIVKMVSNLNVFTNIIVKK